MQNISDKDKKTVAVNIRKLREQAGLTQKELADRLYLSDNVVSKWERGESLPDPETLARLAETFGVEVGAIVYENENARTQNASERSRRRLPQNAFCFFGVCYLYPAPAACLVRGGGGYTDSPESKGILVGAAGKTDLSVKKVVFFLWPAVSTFFAIVCMLLNFIKTEWKVNIGLPVYIDDICKDERNRDKIYKILTAGINSTLSAAQCLFLLLGCCMALQTSVPVVAMWIIVALVIAVPVAFTVAGFVKAVQIRESENGAK